MKTLTESAVRCQIKNGRLCVYHSGKVYDVTDFADKHPGGKELLEDHSGQDVTQLMKTHSDHAHSPAAYKILDKYYIGDARESNGMVRHRLESNGVNHGLVNGNNNSLKKQDSNGVAAAPSLMNGGQKAAERDCYEKLYQISYQDGQVDWSKPVLLQVHKLKDKYFDWVHDPVDYDLRLFQNSFFELCSRAPWWLVPLYWLPILSAICWYSFQSFAEGTVKWNVIGVGAVPISASWFPVLFVAGIFMWTFDEYVVHRWLFHMKPPGNSPFLITGHFLLHGQHHKCPMDKTRLVFPPIPATCLGFVIYNVYLLFTPSPMAQVLFAGTIFGYILYDLTHYYLHHGKPYFRYFKNLRKYHVKHHFADQMKGFGISSKMWDYPFGTLIKE